MGHCRPLVIHRNEWERLKNQANLSTKHETPIKVDLATMNEQSQKWISTWPDSVAGVVNKVMMKRKKMHIEDIAVFEAFNEKKKHENTAETLKRARDMIFHQTGYGRELLSALIESKTLDERELQIKFKKEMREKEKKIEETKIKVDNIMYAEFETGKTNRLLMKQEERATAEYNKVMADMKREDALRAAETEKKNRIEDAEMIDKFHQLQISEEKHHYCLDKEGVQLYEEQNKVIQEKREKRDMLDQVLADIWRKYQDKIRRREKQVLDQIHKEKHNTQRFQENYELVQHIQNKEKEKYNDFVDKGVKEWEKRLQEREKEENLKKEELQRSKIAQVQHLSESQTNNENCREILTADKQSFLPTRRGKRESKLLEDKMLTSHEGCVRRVPEAPPRPLRFLGPSTSLQQALKRRQAQPSGWSGTDAMHEQFAQHAGATLAEATHKRLVRKVIDSYRTKNNVKDLQVPNY